MPWQCSFKNVCFFAPIMPKITLAQSAKAYSNYDSRLTTRKKNSLKGKSNRFFCTEYTLLWTDYQKTSHDFFSFFFWPFDCARFFFPTATLCTNFFLICFLPYSPARGAFALGLYAMIFPRLVGRSRESTPKRWCWCLRQGLWGILCNWTLALTQFSRQQPFEQSAVWHSDNMASPFRLCFLQEVVCTGCWSVTGPPCLEFYLATWYGEV